jgi:hypothetical protein
MTKLVSILVLLLLLAGAWQGIKYWEQRKAEQELAEKEAAARVVHPEQLPGMPYELQASLDAAEQQGPAALGRWLKTYCRAVRDPRLAWIELDYCRMIARENPAEAKRIFIGVKERTPASSPVWPRVQELKKSFE